MSDCHAYYLSSLEPLLDGVLWIYRVWYFTCLRSMLESPWGNKLSFLNCCLFYMYNSYSHLFQCLSGMSLWISIKMFFSKVLLNRRVFRIFMFHVIVLLMTSLSTIWHEGNIQRKLIAHQRYVRASCLPFPGTWLLKTLAHAKLSLVQQQQQHILVIKTILEVLFRHERDDLCRCCPSGWTAAFQLPYHNTHFCTGVILSLLWG